MEDISNPIEKQFCRGSAYLLSHFSRVQLFATPWTVDFQAPLSIGFPRQEYWSELPFPSPGDLSEPGIELRSPGFSLSHLGSPNIEYYSSQIKDAIETTLKKILKLNS